MNPFIPIIRPAIFGLHDGLIAGVSTRKGGVSPAPLGMNTGRHDIDDPANVATNRMRLCAALGIDMAHLATQNQVHSDRIAIVTEPGNTENNDALITRTPNVFLAVSIADCQPVLLYDRANRVVAAVHAGWRGTAEKITTKTVKTMVRDFGTSMDDVFAFIGPCASSCCYEVDDKVAARFGDDEVVPRDHGKYLLDLKTATMLELMGMGVPDTHIEISSCCTICMPEYFHSHRRDGAAAGRMMAIVGLRGA